MKKKLTHNLGLKILAILFAVCLWLISININDPVSPRSYTLSVQLLNMKGMTSAGKYVEVLDDSDNIRVTVRASRSVFNTFSDKNLVATADLNDITEDNKVPIMISTTKTEDKIESIKADKEFINVSVENIKKVQLPINVNVENIPASGYIQVATTTDQNAVIVSGPESVVSKIASSGVDIDVDGATSDVTISLPVHLYDENGEQVEDTRLTKSVNEVSTVATIYQTKTVPIEYEINGKPAEGYILTGEITSSPQSVMVAGKPGVMKNVSKIDVSDVLDVAGADSNVEGTAEIKKYLPDGVILADHSFDGKATVIVGVEKAEERTIELSSKRLHITNMPEGFSGTFHGLDDTITISLIGLKEQLASINPEELNGSVDMAAIMKDQEMDTMVAGTYIADVNFELPESVSLKEKLRAHITVEETE